MVRPGIWRRLKFDGKIIGDVVKDRFDRLKTMMVQQTDGVYPELEAMEQRVKAVVEPYGVPTILLPFYLNAGRQLFNLARRFTGATLQNEAIVKLDTWAQRGLDKQILGAIAELWGITYPPVY